MFKKKENKKVDPREKAAVQKMPMQKVSRDTTIPGMRGRIPETIASTMPTLKFKLMQAGLNETPSEFIGKCLIFGFVMGFFIALIFFLLAQKIAIPIFLSPLLGFSFFLFMFFYRLQLPSALINKRMRELDRDLLFCGRHLLIELKSGVSLFDAIRGITQDYGEVSKQFDTVVKNVNLGSPMHEALQEVAELNPSQTFRRMIWQIVNSLRAGSDVSKGLEAILEQLSQEQMISIRRYGQKLNPVAMMYLLLTVIMPSLGITLLIVLSSFLPIDIGSTIFLIVLAFLAIMNFVFLTMIKTMRPAVEI